MSNPPGDKPASGIGISIKQLLSGELPEPTHTLRWGESIPLDILAALIGGATATLLNAEGQPHSLVLVDSFGQIRERSFVIHH